MDLLKSIKIPYFFRLSEKGTISLVKVTENFHCSQITSSFISSSCKELMHHRVGKVGDNELYLFLDSSNRNILSSRFPTNKAMLRFFAKSRFTGTILAVCINSSGFLMDDWDIYELNRFNLASSYKNGWTAVFYTEEEITETSYISPTFVSMKEKYTKENELNYLLCY